MSPIAMMNRQIRPKKTAVAPSGGSVQSYHWASVSSYLSLSEIDIPASYAFEAAHLDRAHGEAHFAGIKAIDPNFYYAKYELVETFFQDDRDDRIADLGTYCTAHGHTLEDCFLHYYEDTTVRMGGVTFNVSGWGGGSAGARIDARVPTNIFSIDRGAINPKSVAVRGYYAERMAGLITDYAVIQTVTQDDPWDGIFVDEGSIPSTDSYIANPLPNTTSGGQIVEYANRARTAIIAAGDLLTDMGALYQQIREAMEAVKAGAQIYQNIASFLDDGGVELGAYSSGVLTEFLSDPDINRSRGEADVWDDMVTIGGSKVYILAEAQVASSYTGSLSYNAGNYATLYDRTRMYALCSYWMGKQSALHFFSHKPRGGEDLEDFWVAAQERDIGDPSGNYTHEWVTGVDGAGQNYRISRRDYDSGAIILFRTQYGYAAGDTVSRGQPSNSHALGGNYKLLHPDNTLGSTITTIALSWAEGVCLIPA